MACSESVGERLLTLSVENEPEAVLVSYSPGHEAQFQFLDEDKFRIGRMVCRGVRLLCVATEYQSYSRIVVYAKDTLPPELSWMMGSLGQREDGCFVLMFSKLRDELAKYSGLPRMDDCPFAYIVCGSIDYQEEDRPGVH